MSEKGKESFLKRKKASSVLVPEPKDYEYSAESDIEACGLDRDSFEKRNREMFDNLTVDSSNENPVITVCRAFEQNFSKRELAFLLGKETLIQSYNESLTQKQQDNGK